MNIVLLLVTHYTEIQHIAENKKIFSDELSTVKGSQIMHKYV